MVAVGKTAKVLGIDTTLRLIYGRSPGGRSAVGYSEPIFTRKSGVSVVGVVVAGTSTVIASGSHKHSCHSHCKGGGVVKWYTVKC